MKRTIGILLFPDAEELDFAGPWEVLKMAREFKPDEFDLLLIAESAEPVRCRGGMRIVPDVTTANCPKLDVILIPGGQGTRVEVENKHLLDWIATISASCQWVTSVCTGAMLLTAAGPARGKRVTTHWAFVEALRERKEAAEVLADARYVQDGNVVTAAGVSAGIDMALWLIGQWYEPEFARQVQRYMEYDPAPPYAA
ncbi:MAG TPA: DJ-1/PfpI family protein [Rhizomicrobium sp.]|jgi:transcriptional regulator GlxA family with amidase domain|nr:DJ-1/PfpI family protein [Rhizomicrobium sp.]